MPKRKEPFQDKYIVLSWGDDGRYVHSSERMYPTEAAAKEAVKRSRERGNLRPAAVAKVIAISQAPEPVWT